MANRFTEKVTSLANARSKVSLTGLLDERDVGQAQTENSGRLITLSSDRFVPDPSQPRKHFDPEDLALFREGLERDGQLQPILVYEGENGQYNIIAGERRWRAICESEKLNTVTAILATGPVDDELRLLYQIAENKDREDITPYEEAVAVKRFVDLGEARGRSRTECAQRLRINASLLSKYIAIADADGLVAELAKERDKADVEALYQLSRAAKKDSSGAAALIEQYRAGDLETGLRAASRELLEKATAESDTSGPRKKPRSGAAKAGPTIAKAKSVSLVQEPTGEAYILKVSLSERRSVRYRIDADAFDALKTDIMKFSSEE